jgi:hypothetical protein
MIYPKFKVRIVYKSGYFHDFWTWKFDAQRGTEGLKKVECQHTDDANKPVFINIDQIESVWQVGYKHCFRFVNPVK